MVSTPVILLPAESQPPHHNESEGFAPSDPPLSSTKIAQLVRKNGVSSPQPFLVIRLCCSAAQAPVSHCQLRFAICASGSDLLTRFHHHLDAIVLFVPKCPIHLGRIVETHTMRDDERRIDFAALDSLEQQRACICACGSAPSSASAPWRTRRPAGTCRASHRRRRGSRPCRPSDMH